MSDVPPFCDDCKPQPAAKRLDCPTDCTCECHWCGHCDLDRTRRLNHLCNACNAYHATMGQLPCVRILRRRMERTELARLEREAWGAA